MTVQAADQPTARDFPVVERVTASVYEVPTDRPEADGTLAWSKTTLVVAHVSGGGRTGIGYTYASGACKPLIDGELAATVAGLGVLDTGAAWQAMVRAIRNLGRPGLVSCAISAVDTALWDLKATAARAAGQPPARRDAATRCRSTAAAVSPPTTSPPPAQLERWTGDLGIPRVKIKIGESWGRESARDLAQDRLRPGGDRPRRRALRRRQRRLRPQAGGPGGPAPMADHDVTWFEEPVSSDDLDGLREVRDQVAAGRRGGRVRLRPGPTSPGWSTRRRSTACRPTSPDAAASPSGSARPPSRRARSLQVSAHCAPNLHAQVAAAVPNLRHLEYFHDHVRIEPMLFDGALSPKGGSLRPDPTRPGLGLTLKESDAARFRVA